MLDEILNRLRNEVNEGDFSYAKYFRERGELLKELYETDKNSKKTELFYKINELDKSKPEISENVLYEIRVQIEEICNNFIKIFLQPDSYHLLWLLNDIKINERNILGTISPVIGKLSRIIRGGINVYKMNGWMVHVLYGYQILNYNIPKGKPPDTINWPNDIDDIFSIKLKQLYDDLTYFGKFSLKIGAFCHDIGVIEGVQNHNITGEKYVPVILREINITPQTLKKNNIPLDIYNLEEMIKIIVLYHSFINRIGGEYSDAQIKEEVIKLRNKLSKNSILIDFLNKDFSRIILLFGIADLIAVDDNLFNSDKFSRLYKSYEYVNDLIMDRKIERPMKQVALNRLKEMIKERYFNYLDFYIKSQLEEFSFDRDKFFYMLYHVNKIEYGVGILKPMDDPKLVVKALCVFFELIKRKYGETAIKNTEIIFDASINIDALKRVLKNISFDILNNIVQSSSNSIVIEGFIIRLDAKNNRYSLNILGYEFKDMPATDQVDVLPLPDRRRANPKGGKGVAE